MPLADLLPPSFFAVLSVVWGLLWGSFATVAIVRIPEGRSVVRPGSSCDGCGVPIPPWKNIPVFAWLFLRGRASCCGAVIPWRVPVVEALGGALAYLSFVRATGTDQGLTAANLVLALVVFAGALTAIVLTFIDLDCMYLPDGGVVLLAILGAVCVWIKRTPWEDAALGGLVAFAVVYIPFIWGYEKLRGFPGMGLGDAKLLAAVGVWFGWQGATTCLVLAAVQGTMIALCTFMVAGRIDEPEAVVRERQELKELAASGDIEAQEALRQDPLADAPAAGLGSARVAFGPFICLAFLEWLFAEDFLVSWLLPA